MGAIFLDLAKAFDCVNHDILLQKLDLHYGIWGDAYGWMRSFLCGRTQQVCVQDTFSSRGLISYCWSSPRVYIAIGTFTVLHLR